MSDTTSLSFDQAVATAKFPQKIVMDLKERTWYVIDTDHAMWNTPYSLYPDAALDMGQYNSVATSAGVI